jgi:8-amino-7-oxononanoate synthase
MKIEPEMTRMGSTSASALTTKLTAALASRSARQILRKLPDSRAVEQNTFQIDFTSNDYLSFTTLPQLRTLFVDKLSSSSQILGSGGSRLLVHTPAHAALESRLAKFFGVQAALLFNSGFDANSGFFACIPQDGDVLVYDEYIHASVHDGMRSSRLSSSKSQTESLFQFAHNSMSELRSILLHLSSTRQTLKGGRSSVFIAVESLYSMDGTFAPLADIVEVIEEVFPLGNAYLVVDEAHATGVYGPQGRGRVAQLGLESKVLMRLCTFGKGLGGTGGSLLNLLLDVFDLPWYFVRVIAVVLTNALIRDYLVNYARPLIYTTSLSYTNVIAADCAFNLLEDGTAESVRCAFFLPRYSLPTLPLSAARQTTL